MRFFFPILLLCALLPAQTQPCAKVQPMIVAKKLTSPLDAEGLPHTATWDAAEAIQFCADWQGKNADSGRQTDVSALWSNDALYLRFRANYRELYTYPGGPQRRDQLWDRDVAEVFLQNPEQSGRTYAELEVSPNGDWIDLAITNGQRSDLACAMKTRVRVDEGKKIWTAEVAVPMKCLAKNFDPKQPWRVNFFRIEGPEPRRFYSSWQPTKTPQPNFHVPEVFAPLKFE